LAPSGLLPGGQLFAAQEDLVNIILKTSAFDKDLLWCQIQSHKSNDLDARFIQLVLLALNDDTFVDGVKGFWKVLKLNSWTERLSIAAQNQRWVSLCGESDQLIVNFSFA